MKKFCLITTLLISLIISTKVKEPKVFLVFNQSCWEKLTSFTITLDCLKSTIANGLSITIVSLSLFYKLPQIKEIVQNKSADGMNWFSYFLDIVSITSNLGYFYSNDFPLMNYAEMIFNLIQTWIIFALIYYYGKIDKKPFLVTSVFNLVLLLLQLSRVLPSFIVQFCFSFSSLLYCFSRGSSIYEILKIRFSGSNNIITNFLSFAGFAARTFTLWVDSDDIYLLTQQLIQLLFATVLFLSVVYFKKPPMEKKNK